MQHNNTKYWAFTWETNVRQKKLPDEERLIKMLNWIADYGQFQKERGEKNSKLHYQGCFTLTGPRQSKRGVLSLFEKRFKNTKGLTLSKVYDKNAILDYTSKQETRVGETIYCGKKEMYNIKFQKLLKHEWQKEFYQHLLDIKNNEKKVDRESFYQRAIHWVEDKKGGAGKSELITYLRAGQRNLKCRLLPIDSVDRLMSAVVQITQKEEIDVFMIDDTRTRGTDTSMADLFEAIERIKNGHVVSTMYGKYVESIYPRPQIVFFTNSCLETSATQLSLDRWYYVQIEDRKRLKKRGWVVGTPPYLFYQQTHPESDQLPEVIKVDKENDEIFADILEK